MPRGSSSYGPWQSVLFARLDALGATCDEATAAFLSAKGKAVTANQVCQWRAGNCHLPLDAALLIADHVGDVEALLGEALRARGLDLRPVISRGQQLPQLVRSAQRAMGQVQVALADARDPEGEGGDSITPGEAEALLGDVRALGALVAQLKAELESTADHGHIRVVNHR